MNTMLQKIRIGAAVSLVVFLAMPFGLTAQDEPFLGVWELNLAKSSLTRGAPRKSETIVNSLEPGGFRSLLAVVGETSTSVEIQHFVFDGAYHQTEGSDPRKLSCTRTDRRTIEQDTRRNGAVTVHRHITVSDDGRALTYVANGRSGNGQAYTNDTRVYEKK